MVQYGVVATNTARISSEYGYRDHPILKERKHHNGIDIACAAGTPILAASSGTVTHKEYMRGYGNVVFIKDANGIETRYAHMRNFAEIQPGDVIQGGQVIGYVGSTGQSTGPHLHFEVRINGKPVNPHQIYGNDLRGTDFNASYPNQYTPWHAAQIIANDPQKLKEFQMRPKLEAPTWTERNMPESMGGWPLEKLQQYDYQCELQQALFPEETLPKTKDQPSFNQLQLLLQKYQIKPAFLQHLNMLFGFGHNITNTTDNTLNQPAQKSSNRGN